MSQSSFSVTTDEGSVDSVSAMPRSKAPLLSKSGSVVLSLSMAQFYGQGKEDVEDDDFGLDNPFIKELGLEDKKRLSQRKMAIEEAAKVASARAQLRSQESFNKRPGMGDKQLSSTQFSPAEVRHEFIKRQDASAKAFQPAILQALAERQSSGGEAPIRSIPSSDRKSKRMSAGKSLLQSAKAAIFGAPKQKQAPQKDKKMVPPRHEQEIASW